MITVKQTFLETYPSAHVGILVLRDVKNVVSHPELESRKRALEADLRSRFADKDVQVLENTSPLPAYTAFYKRFDKTYHVLGQLKSIIYKEKSIPSVASLVEAMFIAELKNGLLTAGHDLDKVEGSISINVASGDEHYTVMRGVDQQLKSGDMYISDSQGILSAIIYGPDQRTQITPETKNVLFTIYAPEGILPSEVEKHLTEIRDLVLLVTPNAKVDTLQVIGV
ncbi:MAG: phenylalanine--tRNA ligase beta subunit-related protein [Anaerolineaceae bacterium]|nr:phenylalanine--tRNA ligase beta subunit-related protein [Anaerolineaceae bacterium]